MMNCEEFELRGLDLDRPDANPEAAAEAANHVHVCGRCSALLELWREVKGELRLLRDATQMNSAPMRVEMRLKQELRTRREERVPRGSVAIAVWAMAAAAVLAISFGWVRTRENANKASNAAPVGTPTVVSVPNVLGANDSGMLLAADYDTGEFTELPGSMPSQSNDRTVLQVRMQRGALARFGLPVEQERAAEWVNVDFLVGEDGQPQGVRLHQDSPTTPVTQ
jgi:hypothetical protein